MTAPLNRIDRDEALRAAARRRAAELRDQALDEAWAALRHALATLAHRPARPVAMG